MPKPGFGWVKLMRTERRAFAGSRACRSFCGDSAYGPQQYACCRQDGDSVLFQGGDHGTPEAAAEQYDQLALLSLPKGTPLNGSRRLVRAASLDDSGVAEVRISSSRHLDQNACGAGIRRVSAGWCTRSARMPA